MCSPVPPTGQSKSCADYVDCYHRTGGTLGALDSTYGPAGICWTSGASAASSCNSACCTGYASLVSAYPNAGCGTGVPFDAGAPFDAGPPPMCSPLPPDGGQSVSCADYVDCYYRTGGTVGSLDSTYGPAGTCWTTGSATAGACNSACCSAYASLVSAYPTAGCGSGIPFDAGPPPMMCSPPTGADGGISPGCIDYVTCYELTGGTPGSLNSSYGPGGTCWTSGSAVASSCTSACCSAIQSLKSAYPDAGCR